MSYLVARVEHPIIVDVAESASRRIRISAF
jgi:hypothetical protein